MNKLIFTLAALTVSVATASAQAPMPAGPAPAGCPTAGAPAYGPMYGGPVYDGYNGGGHGFGLGGHLKGGIGHTGFLGGIFCNHGGFRGRGGDPYANATPLPVASGGTLVFPQNPFVRSPRDYFMWDER